MLSIETPPPDPPYQQLKINNNNIVDDDETQNLPNLPEEEEEDLSNAAVRDHSTFPNFSLRDYVFGARSKDIRNNWPFSLKNLQLCLKHGVKDLLPPFQSPDCVRNQRFAECGGGSSTSEFQNTSVFHGEFSKPKEHVELLEISDAKLDEKQVSTCAIESSSCRREGENGFSSTMTSISQPQKELVSTSGPSSSSLKTDHLLKTPVEVETTGFPASEKNEIKIKTSGKRCKIIRKSTNHIDQTSAADIAMSFSTVSESMASKICPVCKTFSSSSNTTLNAHIDQCLSIASSTDPKCTSDSKLTRYKVKLRKTKLMVDIYATARPCTLEELDRRNGTTWATLSAFAAQDIENCQASGGKKQKVVQVHPEDIGNNNAGAVYIDANGTKLRILSKFNSTSSLSKVPDDLSSRKLGGVKGRKFHSAKKKNCYASKHHKYFKVAAAQGRKISSQKCISQVQEGHNQRKGSSGLELHKITKQAKPYDSGTTFRQWACSKRTRASKSTKKESYQPSTFKWHVSHDMAVDTDRSVLADSFPKRSQVQDQTNSSEHCVSSPESSERTDNTDYEARMPDKRGWSPVRRNLRSSFSGEMVDSGSPTWKKKNTNHLSKGGCFVGNNYVVKPQNSNGKIIKDYQPSDLPPGFSNKLSRNYHTDASKARELNSFRKKEMLVSRRLSTAPQFNRFSNYEKSGDRFRSHVEEEIVSWHSTFDHSHSSSDGSIESDQSAKEEVTEVVSHKVSSELKNTRNREATRKAIALSSSESEPEYDGHHEENMDSHVRMSAEQEKLEGLELGSKENSFHEDVTVDSTSKLAPKESFTCFCKSMDPQFQKTNNNVKARCGMLQSSDQNCSCSFYGSDGGKGGFSESSFGHGQEMFFTDEDCSAMIGHDGQRELDSEARRGSSCFEVDPISIPGPPGSFLPSPPRDMRSEEYRGNSSMSNSWVHSCQDRHDLVDGDSSGSPVSATSTISNCTASRARMKHNNNSSGVSSSYVFHDKLGSASPNAGALPCVENDVGFSHIACTGDGRIYGDMFKVNKLSVEKETLGIVNDGQPCRCQRVGRVSQGINVTYQEPQLTRYQALISETRPAMDRKPITYSLNNVRPKSLGIMPEGPALSNCQRSMSENMGFPVDKSPPLKSFPIDGCSDLGLKFSRSNCEPASPVTSNSVLRLMGKNLMVVNKDEEDVVKQPHSQHNHVSTQVPSFAGGSSQNVRNQASCSFPHWPYQDPLKDQNAGSNVLGRNLDVGLSKGFRSPANLNMPSSHVREPAALFLKQQQTDEGHTASGTYKSDYTNKTLDRLERKQNEASVYNTSRTLKMPDHHQQMNSLSATNAIKEINAMSDGSYCEARLIANDPNYPGGMRTTLQIIAPGVSAPFTSSGNQLHVNAFCCYPPKDASNLDKPATIHNSSFQSASSRKDHTSPVKWDCNSESPYVCRRGVF